MAVTKPQMASARRCASLLTRHVPRVVDAWFDLRTKHICLALDREIQFEFPADLAEGLAGANARDLQAIEISPSGYGIHFPRLDVDFHLPSLLEGLFGTRAWMSELGRKGARTGNAKAARSPKASNARVA